jgi:hypothetical protein
MTIVFVFSRASDFIMRTSSFVHGRPAVTFFAISLPHEWILQPNHRPS